MSWWLSVNEILPDEITKLDHTLLPPNFKGDRREARLIQDNLGMIVNTLGEQSSRAQGMLRRVITTATKLQNSPNLALYLLKDSMVVEGGEVVGLLKVGRKRLMLPNSSGHVVDCEPLCVLDFYVQAARQRHGYGKMLFDYMLKDQNAKIEQLAIDGPSPKMVAFIKKHYGADLLQQSNNFSVTPEFFRAYQATKTSGDKDTSSVSSLPVGRFAACPPRSTIGQVIHGSSTDDSGFRHAKPNQSNQVRNALCWL